MPSDLTAPGTGGARTLVISHPDCERHDTGPGHPENAGRLAAVLTAVDDAIPGLGGRVARREGRHATEAEVARVHRASHIERIREATRRASDSGGFAYLDLDTVVSPDSWRAALAAAGCVLAGLEALRAGSAQSAFCAARPPGHHATADRAMGFCLFNNVAIGVRHAQTFGWTRALIVDWDVHHGNGSEAIFYEDPDVFYLSLHQSPHYPGTGQRGHRGHGRGDGMNLNLPMPPGLPAQRYVAELLTGIDVALSRFSPDIIFISAGFDSAYGDPLAGLTLAPGDFHQLTRHLAETAAALCAGRIVSVLEGGYDPETLADCSLAHIRALAGLDPE
jgi:acetoin utilization deacetylase AcuC-like enzyme